MQVRILPGVCVDTMLRDLVGVMRVNRRRYGSSWRKVRLDRLTKLLPGISLEEAERLAIYGVDQGQLELVGKLDDTSGTVVPAVKLKHYLPRRYRRESSLAAG